MGGPFDPNNDDGRLFRECEKILLGIPRTSDDIFSCALTIKQLAARLPSGCASDISVKNVRQVLSQPAHQDVLVALDDVSVVHVKKFEEQVQAAGMGSAEAPAGEPNDAACNFWDAPASLGYAEQEVEEDVWRQDLRDGGQHKTGGELQRMMQEERAESGAAQAATPSASPSAGGKNVQDNKQKDPPRAGSGKDNQGGATPHTGPDNETQRGAGAPFLSSYAVGWPSSAHAASGCPSQATNGDPKEEAAEAGRQVKQQPQPTSRGGLIAAAVAEANGITGSRTAAFGLDPVAPGGEGGGAEGSSGGGRRQEEVKEDSVEEQLGKLRHCQDEIKRLLVQRHAMEAAIRARLAQRAQAPGQVAQARQLAAQLAQIVGATPQLPGTFPEQAPTCPSEAGGVIVRAADPGRHDSDGHAAVPSAGRTSGRTGGQGAEPGGESDVEVMDTPPPATDWARKRETAVKRQREGQSRDAGAKRARGSEASDQGMETGMEGQSERQKRKEKEHEEKMDQSGAGQGGNGTARQGVAKEGGSGLGSRSVTPDNGRPSPPAAEPAPGGPPGGSECPGMPSAATGTADPVEQRRSGMEAAAASTSHLWPELLVAVEKLVMRAEASGPALTQQEIVAEVERRGIGTDESLVGRALDVVRAKRAAAREEKSGGERPLEAQRKQLGGVPSEPPMAGTFVALHAPASGGAKAGEGEQDKEKAHAADTAGEAAQTARARGESTGKHAAYPAARKEAPETKMMGLGFKRKRHGAAPKRKRMEPAEPVHLDWNINGEDEAASALLESLLSQCKASASVADVDWGRGETPHVVAATKANEGLEASTAAAIRGSKAQTRAIKHRKQDRPQRLVMSSKSISV